MFYRGGSGNGAMDVINTPAENGVDEKLNDDKLVILICIHKTLFVLNDLFNLFIEVSEMLVKAD